MNSPYSSATTPAAGHEQIVLQGRYRVTRCLGSGGMGDVYLADDIRLGRLVAIKSLKREFCKMDDVRKRIERECVLHARIGAHPNIITLYDRIEENGLIHLVIEYVDGCTLKDVIDQARSGQVYLTWRDSVSIACQMLEALAKIHAQDVVHRDVKPANVMLVQNDTGGYVAKMMDFGIARLITPVDGATLLTRQGSAGPGTPIYMSPEQIAGEQYGALSPASDVYAMGIVLFQMLTGRPPFQGTITDIFNGHLNQTLPDPAPFVDSSYPSALTEVLHKATAKRPADRYASASEFRYFLRRVAKSRGAVTSLAVADTQPADSGVTMPATVQLTPIPGEMSTGSGMLFRRRDGANSARRIVAIVAVILAAVVAAIGGNVLFFGGLSNTAAPAQPQGVVTPATPSPAIATAPIVQPAAQVPPPSTPAPATTPPANPQPAPVAIPAAAPVAEAPPAEPPAETVAAKPKPVAAKPASKPKPKPVVETESEPSPMDDIAEATPERTPVPRAKTPVPFTYNEPKERTPVPYAPYPTAPDVRAPLPPRSDADAFRDSEVRKLPTVKIY